MGDQAPCGQSGGLCEDDAVTLIGFELPLVGWMGLADVDEEKLRPVLVRFVQLLDGARLAPKRRSRIAAEDEYDGFLTLEL